MLKANYHTHSVWCKHAQGRFVDYIQEAIRVGFEELAITDHCPHKYSWCWLHEDEVPEFDRELNEAIATYGDKIRLLKGFECEYIPAEMEYFTYLKEELGYKFMIMGQHCAGRHQEVDSFNLTDPKQLRVYADTVCEGLETKFFTMLAHPDVIFSKYPRTWDADCEKAYAQIFETCEKLHIPIEININGLRGDRGYPNPEMLAFSKDYDLKYLLNSDAHNPNDLYDDWAHKAEIWTAERGIQIETFYPWDWAKEGK